MLKFDTCPKISVSSFYQKKKKKIDLDLSSLYAFANLWAYS